MPRRPLPPSAPVVDRSAERAKARVKRYARTAKGKATRKEIRGRRFAREAATQFTLTAEEWQQSLDHFGGCAYCGKVGRLERDHFLPVSMGGSLSRDNTVPACRVCNASKREIHPLEWMMERKQIADYVRIFLWLEY